MGIERIRLADLFDDVLEDYRLNERGSIVQLQSRPNRHLVPMLGGIRVSEFSTSHIMRYLTMRLRAGATNATINRELEIVQRALALGARCEPPKVQHLIHIPSLEEN